MKAKTARRFLKRNLWKHIRGQEVGTDFSPSFQKRWNKAEKIVRMAK